MITIGELDRLVEKEFESDQTVLDVWKRKKDCLGIHPEPEYKDAESIIWVDTNQSIKLYEEELAYFLQGCGCSLDVTQDYVDGSPTFYVSLPTTEEEYQKNLIAGKEN